MNTVVNDISGQDNSVDVNEKIIKDCEVCQNAKSTKVVETNIISNTNMKSGDVVCDTSTSSGPLSSETILSEHNRLNVDICTYKLKGTVVNDLIYPNKKITSVSSTGLESSGVAELDYIKSKKKVSAKEACRTKSSSERDKESNTVFCQVLDGEQEEHFLGQSNMQFQIEKDDVIEIPYTQKVGKSVPPETSLRDEQLIRKFNDLNALKEMSTNDSAVKCSFDHSEQTAEKQGCKRRMFLDVKEIISNFPKTTIYSYSFLIASSLCHLFTNSDLNRRYRNEFMKKFLKHFGKEYKHHMPEMMLLVNGEVQYGPPEIYLEDIHNSAFYLEHGPEFITNDLLLLSLQDGKYDARSRTLINFVCGLLKCDSKLLQQMEDDVKQIFLYQDHNPTEEELKEKQERAKKKKYIRAAMIGLASIGGGALIGLTAGLAAPFVAGSLGLISGTIGTALFATKAGVAIVGSLFGMAGAGLTGSKMNKRIGNLVEFEFEELTDGKSLNVTIAVSGWLNETYSDFRKVWMGLSHSKEQYVLRYEAKHMRELGEALKGLADIGISLAVSEGLKHTVFSGLISSIMWPMALLNASYIIDNPWSVCTKRSCTAGKQLAEVLLAREQGQRPVTLIGFGFGARVVFSCLEEMSERKNCEGIVEEAIMLGSPVSGNPEIWKKFKRVVSGRVVNGYCRTDWMLKFMYRAASMQLSVAGLEPVEWNDRMMFNVDLSNINSKS